LRGTLAQRPILDSFDTEENAYAYDGLGRFPSHTVDVAPAVSYGPAVSEKRLSLTAQGKVRYELAAPAHLTSRDGGNAKGL